MYQRVEINGINLQQVSSHRSPTNSQMRLTQALWEWNNCTSSEASAANMTLCQQTRRDTCSLMLCSSSCPETVAFVSSIGQLRLYDAISGHLLTHSDISIHSVVEPGHSPAHHARHTLNTDGNCSGGRRSTSVPVLVWLCQMIGLISMLNWRLVQQPDMEVVASHDSLHVLDVAHRTMPGRVGAAE